MPTPYSSPGATGNSSCRPGPTDGDTGEGRKPSRQMLNATSYHEKRTPPMDWWISRSPPGGGSWNPHQTTGSATLRNNLESRASKMADSQVLTVPDNRRCYGDETDTGDYARDPIKAILDHFWARLQALLHPERPHHPRLQRDRVDGSRAAGDPPQGKPKPHTTGSSIQGPPGLRATGVIPPRFRPHPLSTLKRLPTQTAKTLRTTPTGPTLGLNGSQAHGLRAPAHTRSWGRGENSPVRHHGSTQQQRTSKGNHKHGIKLKMGGRQANSGAAVPQERAGSRYSTTRHICVATHPHRRHPQVNPGLTAQLLNGLDLMHTHTDISC
ncbi:Hypothetical predicted protein [Pelobates cultripes]|uniref:Uncharacterized protein n=1 Tax=Pelobates cultripes TaxID=61616 RepID=A0AAD1SIU0_PELCU|nr:Hypothetical predicted protein [Pelobates cultripes]